jgi:hypothetical protein
MDALGRACQTTSRRSRRWATHTQRGNPMQRTILALILLPALAVAVTATGADGPARQPDQDFVLPQPVEPLPEPLASVVAGIGAPALAAHIRLLASPSLEGRGLGERGLDAALEYVAASLELAGIAPPDGRDPAAGAAAHFQLVPLREVSGQDGAVAVARESGGHRWSRSFALGVDCLLPYLAPQTISAPVVFAGWGIREPELGHDDYRGLDVRGRIVLLFTGAPDGGQWQSSQLQSRWNDDDPDNRYDARLEVARELGAAAVLAIERDGWAEALEDGREVMHRFFLPADAATPGGGRPPLAVASVAAAEALLGAEALASSMLPAAPHGLLPGVTATITASGSERRFESRNVLGVIAGADPALRDEVVMIGAHLDHLGRSGDVIYPGADDNASGSAALLEIANAFASSPVPPKRTLVFAFWTGEEEGKFGSGHYVRHPVWPLERTTYLNLDMIGHPWLSEEIAKLVADTGLEEGSELLAAMAPADFVELGLPPGRPELESALRRAATGTGLALHFDHTSGIFGGSDYRDFARAGVPFIRFFGNFFPGYHEPSDRAESLDAAQVQRVARLAAATAWLLANR